MLKASAVMAMEAVISPAASLVRNSSKFKAMPIPPERIPQRCRLSGA